MGAIGRLLTGLRQMLSTDSPADAPLVPGSVLRQHFITQIYAKVVDTIGLFQPKAVTINNRLVMRNDPDVAFGSAVNRGPLINAQWTVQSRDEKIKAFVDSIFRTHFRAIARSASLAIGFGYQVTEKVWKSGPVTIEIEDKIGASREVVKIPMAWTFDRFKSIDPRTVVLHVDPLTDQWDGVQQYAYLSPAMQNPTDLVGPERVGLWTHAKDDNFGRLTGRAMFDQAYTDWWDKQAIGMYANRYFETKGDPTPIGRALLDSLLMPDGTRVDGFEFIGGVLRMFKGGNGVVLPSDRDEKGNYKYDVELKHDDKRGDQFESYLKYKSGQILQALLTPPRVGGAHAGSGLGTKDAGVQQDQHAEFLESILYDFFDYVNEQYVNPLVIYNFGQQAFEESKTRLVVSGLSAGMKSMLKDILFKAFDEEMTLGSGKNIPLYKRLDCPAIMKELDVPMPSAEDLAELEAEQQEINDQNDQMQKAAMDAGGGGTPPKEPNDDLSRMTYGEDLGEINTETLSADIMGKVDAKLRAQYAEFERQRTLELAAKKPDPAPVVPQEVHHHHETVINNPAPAAPVVTVPVTVQPAAAPAVQMGDTVVNLGDTNIKADLNLKPGDKKTVEFKKDAEGKIISAEIKPSEGGGA
jgi:hypothetical protein